MSTQKTRQWEAERAYRIVLIEHSKAFSDLAHAVYASDPPLGGWPEAVQQRLDDCKRVAERIHQAHKDLDRASNRA